jgi:non-lysosomal glucosylceramidase
MMMKKGTATMILTTAAGLCAAGAAESSVEFRKLPTEGWSEIIPADKNLDPDWVASLFGRGAPRSYSGDALMNIGMPVGGITAGLVYLGGDGKLWWWDIFNRPLTGIEPRQIQYKDRSWHGLPKGLGAWQGGNYVEPVTTQPSPFGQGFSLRLTVDGKEQVRTLDRHGWKNVTFSGAYPYGTVTYSDPDCPVTVKLEAFSPYIPLDFDSSSYPATIMRYSVENTGGAELGVEIGGWMENPVLLDSGKNLSGAMRVNKVTTAPGYTMLLCAATPPPVRDDLRDDILFEDFEKETYEGWKVEGTAFGKGPIATTDVPPYMSGLGARGDRSVNSHASAADGEGVKLTESFARDAATGRLTSKAFNIERDYISFLIGGGSHPECALQLVVDGKVVRSATGHNGNKMRPASFDVKEFAGREASIRIIDESTGGWGNIGVDHIVFTDNASQQSPTELPDWGTMALAALGNNKSFGAADKPDDGVFPADAQAPVDQVLAGSVTQTLALAPGASGTADFVIAWHFANTTETVKGAETGHYYGGRFKDAAGVVAHIAENHTRLVDQTRLWMDTWYDSTLPYWFLERTFIPLNCLASTTCYRFADGRFYTYEGIRSCPGHPDHVWHYAQGHARVFPELEQDVIERVWLGFGFNEETGSFAYRGEIGGQSAIDGHCGVILSVLRAHQTNPDDAMLKRLWPRVKKAVQFAISRDRDNDGLLDTPMLTTLDEPWFGQIPWISSMYIAALRAGEEMALEMGDTEFANECRERAEKGRAAMDAKLFNGEWFVQIPDPEHPKKLGAYETVHIDQVLGQAWAWQVGLGRVLNEDTTRSALRSIWKYNFTRNLDAYDEQADPKGRPYYTDGEGGLVMTANALGREVPYGVYSMYACYLSETMNGFEYQAAAHMIAEGLVKEGLAVIRTVDDRYDGEKRNPFNEVECGDHYARSMAGYGALITICGFEYHGPKGHIGFAPKLTPEDFRAPFTAAKGWGTYAQKMTNDALQASIALKYGGMKVNTISLEPAEGASPQSVKVTLGGKELKSTSQEKDGKIQVTLDRELDLAAGQTLEITIK